MPPDESDIGGVRAELAATLDAGSDHDAEELLELTQGLRSELLELDVDAVRLGAEGEAPEGAKGVELLAFGGLAIEFVSRSPVLRSVVETTVAWLGRQQARSAKLTLDGDTLEVTGVSSDEQSRLVEQWIARHADDG
ncbi:MAG TPA: hypothetical protein VHQ43_10030 [Solirubrobacterales bacterium]|jgi:hypothetical protein|nr:hypothetical protein [Solirubrobacterales bacterium]